MKILDKMINRINLEVSAEEVSLILKFKFKSDEEKIESIIKEIL